MKSRRFILGMVSAALLFTGYFRYAYGSEVSAGDWQSRGIYIDLMRSYWWPTFIGCAIAFMVIIIQRSRETQDDQDTRVLN